MNSPVILVIDDNPITRKLARITLQAEGYAVVEAGDGRSAVEQVAQHLPDLILQDLILPDMDGFALLERLRALPGGAHIPILAFSASVTRTEEARSLPLGFTDYLSKPIEPSTLLHMIRSYVQPIPAPAEKPGRERRLLVVDDDPTRAGLLKLRLEQLGFRVTTAADGQEALDRARGSRPDAIVSDVLMPRVDGLRLCQEVRRDPQLARIPVVLFTAAYPDEAGEQLAHSVGASALVLHTPDLVELSEALFASLRVVPPPAPAFVELAGEEYTHALIRQLERQAGLNVSLKNRLGVLEAEFAIVGGLAETLKNASPIEVVLGDLLHHYLNAGGISQGIAYLLDAEGRLALGADLGYGEKAAGALAPFFGHAGVLHQVMEEGEPLTVPGSRLRGDQAQDLLKRAAARSVLITPILLGEERLGVLVIASAHRHLGGDWVSFARAVGCQMGQTLGLARALRRLRESAAALAAADRRKDEFLAMLAHELRNPLSAISNALHVMHLRGADPALTRTMDVAARQVRHMARLIDDLLDVSRITQGQTELRKDAVDLASAVARAVETNRALIEARGHELSTSLPVQPIPLQADADRLEQILSNLLNNAAKYTEPGGRIWITARRDGNDAVVRVRDNGTGIAPELLPHVFDLFTQGERSLDRSQGGLGIGLTLVRRLVELHGGSVTAHSSGPGQGSEFVVRLPLEVTAAP